MTWSNWWRAAVWSKWLFVNRWWWDSRCFSRWQGSSPWQSGFNDPSKLWQVIVKVERNLLDHCTLWRSLFGACPAGVLSSGAVCVCLCVCSQPQLCSQPGHHSHGDLPGGSARSRSINYSRRMNLLCAITFPGSSLTPSQLHEQAWIYPLPRNGLQVVWKPGVWSGCFCCLWKFTCPAACPWDASRKKEHRWASCWISGGAQDFWAKELFPGRHLCLSGWRAHCFSSVFYHIGELIF